MQRRASSSFSCCDGLRASWSVKEPSSSLPAQLPGPALGAGKIGSCLEKQAGGGSEIAAGKRASRAPGCSSSCCSPTGLPGPPRSPAAQPLPVFLPNYGGSGFLPAVLPLLCLAQCRLSLRTGLALGDPPSHTLPWSHGRSSRDHRWPTVTPLQCQASFSRKRGFCLPKSIPRPVPQTQGTPDCAASDARPKTGERAKAAGRKAGVSFPLQEVLWDVQHSLLHGEGVHRWELVPTRAARPGSAGAALGRRTQGGWHVPWPRSAPPSPAPSHGSLLPKATRERLPRVNPKWHKWRVEKGCMPARRHCFFLLP